MVLLFRVAKGPGGLYRFSSHRLCPGPKSAETGGLIAFVRVFLLLSAPQGAALHHLRVSFFECGSCHRLPPNVSEELTQCTEAKSCVLQVGKPQQVAYLPSVVLGSCRAFGCQCCVYGVFAQHLWHELSGRISHFPSA